MKESERKIWQRFAEDRKMFEKYPVGSTVRENEEHHLAKQIVEAYNNSSKKEKLKNTYGELIEWAHKESSWKWF